MARTVKEKEYTDRRNEILDAAQHLVYSKGYEQMTIQDIQDELRISKGAFYHYFGSKQDLLEALIERMLEQMEQVLGPIVHDPHLPALEKLQRFFFTIGYLKTERKVFLLALLRVWFTDDNAIVREKVRTATYTVFTPLLTVIIRQGIQEGTLTTSFPDQAGEIVLSIVLGQQEIVGVLLISPELNHDISQRLESTINACTDAIMRVLGILSSSFTIVDSDILRDWLDSLQHNP